MGGVRPNASENGQISPSTTVRAARTDGSRPNLTSILQEAGKPRIFKPVWESSGESRLTHPHAVADQREDRNHVRFTSAGSTGRRNTGIKSLRWGFKLQDRKSTRL